MIPQTASSPAVPFTTFHSDSPQEAGCTDTQGRATMRLMRVLILLLSFAIFALAVSWMPVPTLAERHHTTVVVVSDHTLPDGEWPAIQEALRANLPNALAESKDIDLNPEIIRGDEIAPGLVVDDTISVHLEGNCTPRVDITHYTPSGALGWVMRRDDQIEPFIHVECDRIVRMLGQRFFGLNRQQQIALLSEAIARVSLHEWVHIATQNPGHRKKGIEKAVFTVQDLDPDYREIAKLRHWPPKSTDPTGAQ